MKQFVLFERNLIQYDRTIQEVEKDLSLLGRVLESGGYPGTMNTLAVVFDKDFIQKSETKSLEGVNNSLRTALEGIILSRLDKSFLSEVEEIRERIIGASVELWEGGLVSLDFKPKDFKCNEDGEIKVASEKKEDFRKKITLTLSEEEEEVCEKMEEIILSLRDIKSRGWGVYALVEKYVGRFAPIPNIDLEELPRDIHISRKQN